MKPEFKISIASFGTRRYGSLKDFEAHVEGLVEKATSAGSAVLLLPELTSTGLLWTHPDAASVTTKTVGEFYRRVLTPLVDDYCAVLAGLAQEYHITIVGASFWHEEDGIGRNSGWIFRPDGKVERQDKLHMTRGERAISTSGGDGLNSFDIDGVKCGLFICYDVQFPELTQHLVSQGVEVLFVPSLTEERGAWRVWHSAHARALESQLFVCVSTLVGPLEIPSDYQSVASGRAFVACPIDNRFKVADGTYAVGNEGEDLLTTSLDLETLRMSREKAEVRQLIDRRPELYKALVERSIA
ncbi:carbon-nitrogen hydrolase family protein [Paraburkholderia oxyphila]|uniref:carbon-nitrogen hydrolase family protein n=1 Tax=Paraburkholderia oxyphila TaxID=614212 RepID=UPI000481B603|nr:carbon-nitrogen hydrolase family protein [Paraburkholderia oxyphila]